MTTQSATLLAQLRAELTLTRTEVQVAVTRTAQARTDAVRDELMQNASNGRDRADAISAAIAKLGGFPAVFGPLVGRTAALVKAVVEQSQPFDEALLGDLVLEHQLLDRARYIKALAFEADLPEITALADRLITAHTATVEWLTTVLAEDALGGPAALRRTPLQAAAGVAVNVLNAPANWVTSRVDRVAATLRSTPENVTARVTEVVGKGIHAGEITVNTIAASGSAALDAAERVTRDEGVTSIADGLHSIRTASGTLNADELPISGYEDLNVTASVEAIRELTSAGQIRTMIAFEEAHKNRSGVVSAAQAHIASLAREVAGI